MTKQLIKNQSFRVPRGKYQATIKSVEEKYNSTYNKNYLLWTFEINHTDPQIHGCTLPGFTGITIYQNSPLSKWLTACQVDMTKSDIDISTAIGKRVLIQVEQNGDREKVIDVEYFEAKSSGRVQDGKISLSNIESPEPDEEDLLTFLNENKEF